MQDYRKLVTAEILLLLFVVTFISPRGRAVWFTLLGQTRLIAGETSPFLTAKGQPPARGVYRFTPVGLVIFALIATKTAKGAWGLLLAYFLGALLTTMFLLNYRQFLSFLVVEQR